MTPGLLIVGRPDREKRQALARTCHGLRFCRVVGRPVRQDSERVVDRRLSPVFLVLQVLDVSLKSAGVR